MKDPKVGIIGVGMVGSALNYYFKSVKKTPLIYDKYKKDLGSLEQVNQADIIFICVPTPYLENKGFDLSAVEETFTKIKGKKIIVLKSTIWPGTTEKLQKKYPQHKILFNPEFLSEATADEDMRHPDVQIVGFTKKSHEAAKKVIDILPKAPFERIICATEAEMFKYFHNVHGAVKVVFANQFYDLCQALKINYNVIKECAAASRHILTDLYLDIWHGKYRGYGGSCFPKDIRALIQFADKIGIDLPLMKVAEKTNNRLIKKQKIKDHEKLGWLRDHNHV